jgi:hypothetical protein
MFEEILMIVLVLFAGVACVCMVMIALMEIWGDGID